MWRTRALISPASWQTTNLHIMLCPKGHLMASTCSSQIHPCNLQHPQFRSWKQPRSCLTSRSFHAVPHPTHFQNRLRTHQHQMPVSPRLSLTFTACHSRRVLHLPTTLQSIRSLPWTQVLTRTLTVPGLFMSAEALSWI